MGSGVRLPASGLHRVQKCLLISLLHVWESGNNSNDDAFLHGVHTRARIITPSGAWICLGRGSLCYSCFLDSPTVVAMVWGPGAVD